MARRKTTVSPGTYQQDVRYWLHPMGPTEAWRRRCRDYPWAAADPGAGPVGENPGVRGADVPRGGGEVGPEPRARGERHALRLDHQPLPWLQPPVCLLPRPRDPHSHG